MGPVTYQRIAFDCKNPRYICSPATNRCLTSPPQHRGREVQTSSNSDFEVSAESLLRQWWLLLYHLLLTHVYCSLSLICPWSASPNCTETRWCRIPCLINTLYFDLLTSTYNLNTCACWICGASSMNIGSSLLLLWLWSNCTRTSHAECCLSVHTANIWLGTVVGSIIAFVAILVSVLLPCSVAVPPPSWKHSGGFFHLHHYYLSDY